MCPRSSPKRDDFENARRRGTAEMSLGAEEARYDLARDAIVLKMRSGAEAMIPRALIPIVSHVERPAIIRLELSPMGTSLSFPDFDADFAVQGLIRIVFGVNEANRIAGATKSPARAAASRENGRKGGRPKKTAATKGRV